MVETWALRDSSALLEPAWRELGVALRVLFYPHPEVVEHSAARVPVNVPVNERQEWFLEQLAAGRQARAADLAAHWEVSEKTAKRDITYLKKHGLVEFVGPPKKGFYRLAMQV